MRAPVAQWIEHLTTDQKVRGSSPFGRTVKIKRPPTCGGRPFAILQLTDFPGSEKGYNGRNFVADTRSGT